MTHPIPPITDPLGRHWEQPSAIHILVDDHHAVMTEDTMLRLAEYSHTNPSGVYPGKMWRTWSPNLRGWLLSWYGECADPTLCSINRRPILLV